MKSLLDSSFRYTPSDMTDLRKTFARVRREQRLTQESTLRAAQPAAPAADNVTPMRPGTSRRTVS